MALLQPKLGPSTASGDGGVDGLADHGGAHAADGLDTLAVVVEAVRGDSFGAVFVGGDGLREEGRRVVEFFVVSPVGAAVKGRLIGSREGVYERRGTDLANLDMLKLVIWA